MKEKLIGIAFIMAGIACMVLGYGFARRRINSNPTGNTDVKYETVKPYSDKTNTNDGIEIIN